MNQRIANISVLVEDYDEAIKFYTQKLQFNLIEDKDLGSGKRWVRMSPNGDMETCILLAKATGATQKEFVGNQTGGRVFLFLQSTDFWKDYKTF